MLDARHAETLVRRLFALSRATKRWLVTIYDLLAVVASYLIAFRLRVGDMQLAFQADWPILVAVTGVGTIVVLRVLGLHHELLRFVGVRALRSLAIGAACAAIVLLLAAFQLNYLLPRSLPPIFALVFFGLAGIPRFAGRLLQLNLPNHRPRRHVVIYGAGSAGRQLLAWLRKSAAYQVECFVDDDDALDGHFIRDVKVRHPSALPQLVGAGRCDEVLLAIPSLSGKRRSEILAELSGLGITVHSVPPLIDLLLGRAHIGEISELGISDLLPRQPIEPDVALLRRAIHGKRVLVTGAGGSVGSELCRQIAAQSPAELAMLDHSEFNLYTIDAEVRAQCQEFPAVRVRGFLGSVLDPGFVRHVFAEARPEVVFHAAAYKHVHLVEDNVVAGVRNNVCGTRIVADEARAAAVENFVLISTDKAVRPTNVMGASKRMAEFVVRTRSHGATTRFSVVRFGNVLGSSGSVVPLFRRQIAAGGPITVTDPQATRFFMTVTEAAQLVIQSVPLAQGNDVFLLDMGQPVRIIDLARRMANLAGTRIRGHDGEEGIEILFTGLRAGEKLHEELLVDEAVSATEHPLILRAREDELSVDALAELLRELEQACRAHNRVRVRSILVRANTGLQEPPSADNVYPLPDALTRAR